MGDKARIDLQLSIHVSGTSLLLQLVHVFCVERWKKRELAPEDTASDRVHFGMFSSQIVKQNYRTQ
jgi:hypothetical protein